MKSHIILQHMGQIRDETKAFKKLIHNPFNVKHKEFLDDIQKEMTILQNDDNF